jgi:hypothetical protein
MSNCYNWEASIAVGGHSFIRHCWVKKAFINESDQYYRYSLNKLRRIVSCVEPIPNVDSCIKFLKITKEENIFLIVSGSLGQKIVSHIDKFTHLIAIYVFCGNVSNHEEWVKQYTKIRGVFTEIEPICQKLRQDVRESNNVTSISIVPKLSTANLNNIDPKFECS